MLALYDLNLCEDKSVEAFIGENMVYYILRNFELSQFYDVLGYSNYSRG